MPLTTDTAASEAEVLTRFEKDTADHELTVLHDAGLYRHLRVAKPGTGMYHFDLITWPGHLTITGDMGTFTFQRTEDMFEFFRAPDRRRINADYWAEKIQGPEAGRTAAKAYSEAAYREHVEGAVADWIESYYENEAQATSLRAAVHEDLLNKDSFFYPGGHHDSARAELRDFEHRMVSANARYADSADKVLDTCHDPLRPAEQKFTFEDAWEWDLTGYDLFFLWCCYAIQDGIHRYDAHVRAAAADSETMEAAGV